MKGEELISIIVPIYKVEKYLRRCIDSIRYQTYSNIEIILVDDGSPDDCGMICDKYAEADSRIKVIHKKNGGLSSARNAGLDCSEGKYIGFVDSDDWIELDMYELLYKKLKENNAEISIIQHSFVIDENIVPEKHSGRTYVYNSQEAVKLLLKDTKIKSHAWDKLYKKEVFEHIRFPEGRYYEDIFIMHNIFNLAEKIVFTDEIKYYYLQRENSIVASKNIHPLLDMMKACEIRYDDLRNFNEIEEYYMASNVLKCTIDILQFIILHPWNGNFKYFRRIKNKFDKYKSTRDLEKNLSSANKIAFSLLKKSSIAFVVYSRIFLSAKSFFKKHLKLKKRIKKIIYYIKYFIVNRKSKFEMDKTFESGNYKTDHKRIFLMGGPEYDNLGDHAIAFATQKYMENELNEYKYYEFSENQINYSLDKIRKIITNDDVLILQGGGNLGNVYEDQQIIRKKVIKAFPNNKIILFPQTIYFTDDKKGKKELRKTIQLFSRHKNLNLLAREKYSYEIMKDNFKENKVYLTPDIVMSYKFKASMEECQNAKRNGILLCLRNDFESRYDIETRNKIKYLCRKQFSNIKVTDTCTGYDVAMEDREKEVTKIWTEFMRSRLVITDRLHGIIFSAITKTPCIALGNFNYKVIGICEWLKNSGYIKFCPQMSQFEGILAEMRGTYCIDDLNDDRIKVNCAEEIAATQLYKKDNKNNELSFDEDFTIICSLIEGRI